MLSVILLGTGCAYQKTQPNAANVTPKTTYPIGAKACATDKDCELSTYENCTNNRCACLSNDLQNSVWDGFNKDWCKETVDEAEYQHGLRGGLSEFAARNRMIECAPCETNRDKYDVKTRCIDNTCTKILE